MGAGEKVPLKRLRQQSEKQVYEESMKTMHQTPRAPAGGRSSRSKSEVTVKQITRYRAQLVRYKTLREELKPWSDSFMERHGRRPIMRDVQSTNVEWLITRFQEYVRLREVVFRETISIRNRIEEHGAKKSIFAIADPAIRSASEMLHLSPSRSYTKKIDRRAKPSPSSSCSARRSSSAGQAPDNEQWRELDTRLEAQKHCAENPSEHRAHTLRYQYAREAALEYKRALMQQGRQRRL